MNKIHKVYIEIALLNGEKEFVAIDSHVYSMWYKEMRYSSAKVFSSFYPISKEEYLNKRKKLDEL